MRTDGTAVACGDGDDGQCALPSPPAGARFVRAIDVKNAKATGVSVFEKLFETLFEKPKPGASAL